MVKRSRGNPRRDNSTPAGAWTVSRIEKALLSGRSPEMEELESWMSGAELAELKELAFKAREGTRRGGPRVYLLPGIMGSSLGLPRKNRDPDVLWIDFFDTFRGRLKELSLKTGNAAATSVGIRGIIWRYYAKLQYRLQAEGFDVVVHDFDWRLSIKKLGAQLAERVAADPSKEVLWVCHSMGGLVGRAALKLGAETKVRRLVMLGTPNRGSFSPVLALRGTHSMARLFALLDVTSSKKDLVEEVFRTFPGLYEMIPERAAVGTDYFDLANWPAKGLRPDPKLLRESANLQDQLAPPGGRLPFHLIAGVNQRTTVAAAVEDDEFVFDESNEGDGTVPVALARIDGAGTYYVEEGHGALPGNSEVAAAVIDLFQRGATDRLPRTWAPGVRALARIGESEIRAEWEQKAQRGVRRSDAAVRPEQVAELLQPFLAAPKTRIAASPAETVSLDRVVVGRRRQRRLDIELAHGDITSVPSRCYVLGIYQGVDPLGAAGAVDEFMGQAIRRILERRMFTGRAGEVFILPCGQRELRCDFVLLAGLGPYDRFDGETQMLVAENTIRTLVAADIQELCCVLLGDSSMKNRRDTLRNMLSGFFRGLEEADVRNDFRRVTICERDDDRLVELRQALLSETASELFDNVQAAFFETDFPVHRSAPTPRAAAGLPSAAHVYLLVRMFENRSTVDVQATVMGANSRAAIGLTRREVPLQEVRAALALVGANGITFSDAQQLGRRLPEMLFSDDLLRALKAERLGSPHLVLVHDATASKIPWETMTIDGWSPAVDGGMSRRYLAADLSMARWQSGSQADKGLQVLLVVNPTQDLQGAEREGERILKILRGQSRATVTVVRGSEASRARLLEALASGRYDVMHYAGHAGFDPVNRTRSGLICAGDEWLTGQDLAGLRSLPPLVFFNACESARVRKKAEDASGGNVGAAESLMRGGVANFIGTYWPVGDAAAFTFADTFYSSIVAGESLGVALCKARGALLAGKEGDWGDYIHFGNPVFQLRSGRTA
jgi:pimeloyl-ACP methyl ester carboxylesterase